ncbi:MAG: HEAT repeat domain-containing protein [Proteobacteria bacterium]|nr:HEAT repeat domain-containing protein [Pseudomonadota bacterium]
MSDVKVAKRVLEEFADDLGRLTDEECVAFIAEGELTDRQCKVLQHALGYGKDSFLMPAEIEAMRSAGLSTKFIKEISNSDGRKALRIRAAWLSDFYLKANVSKGDRLKARAEILDIGANAVESLSALVRILLEDDVAAAAGAAGVLGRLGPAAKDAVPALSSLIIDKMPITAEAERTGEFDQRAIAVGIARINAVIALGEIREESGLRALIKALSDEYKGIRPYAAEAIGKVGEGKPIQGLIKGAIYDLILVSQDDDPKLRDAVKNAFAVMKIERPLIVKWLIAILESQKESEVHRAYAARALGRLGKDAASAVNSLKEIVTSDPSIRLKEDAAYALVDIGTEESLRALKAAGTKESVSALIEGLSSENVGVRRACAFILGRMGSASAAEPIIERLSDQEEDESVKTRCAEALGYIADQRAVPALVAALSADSSAVAAASARSLANIGAENIGKYADKAVGPLISLFKRNEVDAKIASAHALGKIGRKAKSAMDTLSEGLTHADKDVYEMTTIAMMKIDAPKAYVEIKGLGPQSIYLIPVLRKGLASDDLSVKRACALLLSQYGADASSAVPELVRELQSATGLLRETMIFVIGEMGPSAKDALDQLIEICEKGNEKQRAEAIKALARVDELSPSSLPRILYALKDRSKKVRKAAEEALRYVDGDTLASNLVACLTEGDTDAAKAAGHHLAGMKDSAAKAVQQLRVVLRGDFAERMIIAAYVLGEIGGPAAEAAPELLAASRSGDDTLARAAGIVIDKMPDDALMPELAKIALDNGQAAGIRIAAIERLRTIAERNGEAAVALAGALAANDTAIRKVAFKALYDLAGKASPAAAALQALSVFDDPRVRQAAKILIERIGEPEEAKPAPAKPEPAKGTSATPPLSTDLEKLVADLGSPDFSARLKSVQSLSKMKGEAAKAVPSISDLLAHEDADVRKAAAFVLGSIGPDASYSLPYLYRAMRSDEDQNVRMKCQRSIDKIVTDDLSKQTVKAVGSKDPLIMELGIYVVAKIGPSAAKATPQLLKALQGPDERIAEMAARALGAVGSVEAAKGLASAVPKAGIMARVAIAKALTAMGPEAQQAARVVLIKISAGKDPDAGKAADYILNKIGQ